MGKLELKRIVALGPDQFLHNLKKYSGRIFGHGTFGGIEHLIFQCCQSLEAVFDLPPFHGFQQIDNGIGRAKPLGLCHFFYPKGMEKRIIQFPGVSKDIVGIINTIDNANQFMIPAIKKTIFYLKFLQKRSLL
jgi:hypothetical protein